MLKIHWTRTQAEAKVWARENDGQWMSGLRHPLDNHEVIKGMKNGRFTAVAVDITMATGWRVEMEAEVTYAEDFPADGPYRVQAAARVQLPVQGVAVKAPVIKRQIEEADDGGE
jgi:hypothetical protein